MSANVNGLDHVSWSSAPGRVKEVFWTLTSILIEVKKEKELTKKQIYLKRGGNALGELTGGVEQGWLLRRTQPQIAANFPALLIF